MQSTGRPGDSRVVAASIDSAPNRGDSADVTASVVVLLAHARSAVVSLNGYGTSISIIGRYPELSR